MKSVEVFMTNVQDVSQANYLIKMIIKIFPHYLVNFDLEDCDKILRVESDTIDSNAIIRLLSSNNVWCEILE